MIRIRSLILLAVTFGFASLVLAGGAHAGTANGGLPGAPRSNPLAGLPWGVYTGNTANGAWRHYQAASGRERQLLGRIALRPQAFWFGSWVANGRAASDVRQYIANVTGGNPDVLAQIAVFRMDPWEGQACPSGHWSSADQASYRAWITGFASGIGSSRVALVLQPDMPFAVCSHSQVPFNLISYSARVFAALPHTTVYIDAGARYFPMPFSAAVSMLERAGVRYARGFSLNTTEYDSTGAELEYGAHLARALAAAGYRDKHLVISTSENGAPFLNGDYPGNVNFPRVCRNRHDRVCVTLGIPPTFQTSSRQWGLSGGDRALAARYADAYLWVGSPWIDLSSRLDLKRALGLAASTPF
jgi:hypothetical protein